MEQRLTAIFALDMVGYSRLMEADEMGTIVHHKKHRNELIDPAIIRSGGRIVKEMGDGILAEFTSVAGAVRCAIEIQIAIPSSETRSPEGELICYRIGINLGDIMDDGQEVYGDGINVAARLEQMAEPGGICISGTAHDTLRSSMDVAFRPLGMITVKNINRPIQAYYVDLHPSSGDNIGFNSKNGIRFERRTLWRRVAAGAVICATALLTLALTPPHYVKDWFEGGGGSPSDAPISIALFPFSDLSEETGSSYLSAGISEDLATEISSRATLVLITPSTPLKDGTDLAELLDTAAEFGADYVLSGTVQRAGTGPAVSVRLKSVAGGKTLFEKTYARGVNTLASVGEDMSVDIISAIPSLQTRSPQNPDPTYHFPDPAAYDLLLRGNVEFSRFNPAGLDAAEAFYRRAIEADPEYARPLANIAFILALRVAFGWSGQPETLASEAEALAESALRSDPQAHQAYLAKGLLARSQRQYQKAIANFERAIKIAPNSADAHAMIALTHVFAGDPKGGLASIEKAIERNPDHPFNYLYTKGMAQFHLEEFDAAADNFHLALVRNPEFIPARLAYVSALSHLGRVNEAEWELEEVLVRQPEFSLLREQARAPYANTNDTLRYIQGLKTATEG